MPLWYLNILRDSWNDPNSKYDLSKMKKYFSLEELEDEIQKKRNKQKTTPQIDKSTTEKIEPSKVSMKTLGKYIAGQAEKSQGGLIKDEKVIIEKIPNGWKFYGLKSNISGNLSTNEIKGVIRSIRDELDQPISSNNFEELKNKINTEVPAEQIKKQGQEHVLDSEKLSEEQKKIDNKFGNIVGSSSKSHIVIRALAGSGKTTMLKHLAWKYGKPGQKWLYLVFNTKNKVEATEKFPPWVQVKTTNGFLGEILEHSKNSLKINQTKRMVDLVKNKDEKIPSKIRIIADSTEFKNLCSSQFGIPDETKLNIRDKSATSIIKSIRYGFKEEVIRLAELCKSFSINPIDKNVKVKVNQVFDKYDIDSELSEIKKRISKYSSGEWLNKLLRSLYEILGYDIREKDFKEEIIDCTIWILKESLPGATNIVYTKTGRDGRVQKFNLRDYRDFTDDLWYSSISADDLSWPKYDFVLADEVQDFNENQKIMLRKLSEAGAKIVAVGDENQCQPEGTLIHLTGGVCKKIEEIKVGDELVTYNTKKSYFPGVNTQGRKVEEVSSREYEGDIIKIKTENGHSHECTPNHKCVVRFNATNKYCLYLMIQGKKARIGTSRLNYPNGFGPSKRAVQEQADCCWLLDVYDTEYKARVMEAVCSAKFGLPQVIFKNNLQKSPTQDFINEVYENIGDNLENAIKCLKYFGKEFDYPLWRKDLHERYGKNKQNYIGSKKSFITEACNLISSVMTVRTFDGTNRGGSWSKISVIKENKKCIVYSLKVQHTEDGKRLYIANNIVTHNSIYRFRGADSKAFNNLLGELSGLSDEKDVEHSLTTNYRSRSGVIDFVNNATKVKNLKGKIFEDGKAGEVSVEEKDYDGIFDIIKKENDEKNLKETALIARTNQPLAHAALKLLANGVPFVILGKDLASELVKHAEKIMKFKKLEPQDNVRQLSYALEEYRDSEIESHGDQSSKKAQLQELNETTEALLSCIDQFYGLNEAMEMLVLSGILLEDNNKQTDKTIKSFINWLKNKLSGLNIEEKESDLKAYKEKLEKEKPVILTTAHKSKGLEFDRVYVLRDDLFPSPKAKREEDLEQEENAKYVAYTRAKDELHVVKLDGQPGYSKK